MGCICQCTTAYNILLIIIITYINTVPFLKGAYSTLNYQLHLQWQNTWVPQMHLSHVDITCWSHTCTCTHTHLSVSCWEKASFKRWFKRRGWLTKSNFFRKGVSKCWSNVRPRTFAVWLSVDLWMHSIQLSAEDQSCLGVRVDLE